MKRSQAHKIGGDNNGLERHKSNTKYSNLNSQLVVDSQVATQIVRGSCLVVLRVDPSSSSWSPFSLSRLNPDPQRRAAAKIMRTREIRGGTTPRSARAPIKLAANSTRHAGALIPSPPVERKRIDPLRSTVKTESGSENPNILLEFWSKQVGECAFGHCHGGKVKGRCVTRAGHQKPETLEGKNLGRPPK